MPPAVAAVISTIASVVITAIKVSAIVKALLTIAVALAVTFLAKKPNTNKLNQGQELRTKFDPTMPRQVLVGRTATGGSCHFAYTTSDNNKKPNRYLYRVIQLSDRPLSGLVEVREGAQTLTWSGDLTTGWRACNQHRDKNGNAKMWMRVYLGSDTPTADATLVSETGGLWTANHKGVGIAYAIVKYDYDEDAFSSGEPELFWIVDGAKCYDDRKDSTVVGGSGSHRLADPSTWEATDNAAIITAQFLRGFYTNGKIIVGVQAEERDLSTTMLFSAYNTCAQSVTVDAGTEARYEAGMVITANESAADILIDFQAAMDGKIFDRGGSITLLPGANRTPVLALTDDDIDWTAEKSWQPRASLEQMLNHVTSNFVDRDQNFQERNLPILANSAWEADDGGERFTQFFSFRAVNKWTQGQRITKRIHLASRYNGTVAFVGGIWLLELEQGDWITLTSSRWGFTDKYFEIQEHNILATAQVALVCREVHPNIDIWDHSVDEVARSDSSWTPPTYPLPVPDISALGFKVTDPLTGIESFGITMQLDDDPALYGSYIKFIEFQYTWGDESVIANVNLVPISEAQTTIVGLSPSTTYKVRARFRDDARGGDWTAWESVNTEIGSVPGGTTILDARLSADTIILPVDILNAVTSYATASGNFVLTDEGTDVSNSFTLSTGSNPQALTMSYLASPPRYAVTAGLDITEPSATVEIIATGSGAYAGQVYKRTLTLLKNQIQLANFVANGNELNYNVPDTPTITVQPYVFRTAQNGAVDIAWTWSFVHNATLTHKNNVDWVEKVYYQKTVGTAWGGPGTDKPNESDPEVIISLTPGTEMGGNQFIIKDGAPEKFYSSAVRVGRSVVPNAMYPDGKLYSAWAKSTTPLQASVAANVTANINGDPVANVTNGVIAANNGLNSDGTVKGTRIYTSAFAAQQVENRVYNSYAVDVYLAANESPAITFPGGAVTLGTDITKLEIACIVPVRIVVTNPVLNNSYSIKVRTYLWDTVLGGPPSAGPDYNIVEKWQQASASGTYYLTPVWVPVRWLYGSLTPGRTYWVGFQIITPSTNGGESVGQKLIFSREPKATSSV